MNDSVRLHMLVGVSVSEPVATELLERWLTPEALDVVRRAADPRAALAKEALERQHVLRRWA